MEDLNEFINLAFFIVSGVILFLGILDLIYHFYTRYSQSEKTPSSKSESPDSTSSDLFLDPISSRDEPNQLSQNELVEIVQGDYADYFIEEPEWAKLFHKAFKELPVDRLADSSHDDQAD